MNTLEWYLGLARVFADWRFHVSYWGCVAKLAARSHLIALADRGLVTLRAGRYHAGKEP